LFDVGTDILTVQAGNTTENNFNISIFDYTGKLIFSENGSSQNSEIFRQINCASFPSGLFIAKFSTQEDQQVKKFVKN
jgi:hypothetical protein